MTVTLRPLRSQVVLITGATSGIGLAAARRAVRRGAAVVLVARNEPVLRQICAELEAQGGRATFAVADVGDEKQVAAAADKAIERYGQIDAWVNNAGVAIYATLANTPLHEHRRLFQTNYWGVVNGCTEAVRRLRGRGGALITVASVAADMGVPAMGAYAASKHAVKGYIDTLRIELQRAKIPISVTLIKPAGIGTPLGEHVSNHLEGEAKIPPPVYAPDIVADAILDAAERPRREMVIGGAGQAQTLLATHTPALFDRLAGRMVEQIHDPSRPKTHTSNLFRPTTGGQEIGRSEQPRRVSTYTGVRLHPVFAIGVGLVVAGAAAALTRQARSR